MTIACVDFFGFLHREVVGRNSALCSFVAHAVLKQVSRIYLYFRMLKLHYDFTPNLLGGV